LTVSPALRYNRVTYNMQARSSGEAELFQTQRRRRESREGERPAPTRRARRRRQSTPWLQRNALSVAAISVLVALLGVGFGLLQVVTRPESAPFAAGSQPEATVTATASANLLNAASLGPGTQLGAPAALVPGPNDLLRPIHSSARVLDANYTIAAGDTLLQIASRFGTTVDRVQAFNNLSDPRALRIGTKLVIPPPLQP
jgi:nucleoid-associated protein YgaU